eukprot:scaffold18052_cov175-Amphora_coffeaeformis.AAC.16
MYDNPEKKGTFESKFKMNQASETSVGRKNTNGVTPFIAGLLSPPNHGDTKSLYGSCASEYSSFGLIEPDCPGCSGWRDC